MLTYEPHKGKSHSAAIDGDTYMFVASAHHCLPSRQKKYGCDKKNQDPSECIMEQFKKDDFCPAFNSPCPLLETCKSENKNNCDERKKLLCETKICIHDHITNKTEPNPVFSDFYAFREKLIKEKILVVTKEENKYSLWSKVCFQNYIQTITTNIDNDQNIIEEGIANVLKRLNSVEDVIKNTTELDTSVISESSALDGNSMADEPFNSNSYHTEQIEIQENISNEEILELPKEEIESLGFGGFDFEQTLESTENVQELNQTSNNQFDIF